MLTQKSAVGALPTVRAATDLGVLGGQYYGPSGRGEVRGHPRLVASSTASHDQAIQQRLWTVSEELTGVTFLVSDRDPLTCVAGVGAHDARDS